MTKPRMSAQRPISPAFCLKQQLKGDYWEAAQEQDPHAVIFSRTILQPSSNLQIHKPGVIFLFSNGHQGNYFFHKFEITIMPCDKEICTLIIHSENLPRGSWTTFCCFLMVNSQMYVTMYSFSQYRLLSYSIHS